MKERRQRLVVCLLCVRGRAHEREILLQRRNKAHDDTPYDKYFELPQGKVEAGESLTEAARRELMEEAGLVLSAPIAGSEIPFEAPQTSELWISHPFICVVDRIQNHVGLAIVVQVEGIVADSNEADSQGWHTDNEVDSLLRAGRIFPLNRPMLTEYLHSRTSQD